MCLNILPFIPFSAHRAFHQHTHVFLAGLLFVFLHAWLSPGKLWSHDECCTSCTQDYREREQRTCPKNVIRDNGKMINKKIKSQEEWSRLSGLQRDSVFFERVILNPCLRRSMDLLKKKKKEKFQDFWVKANSYFYIAWRQFCSSGA